MQGPSNDVIDELQLSMDLIENFRSGRHHASGRTEYQEVLRKVFCKRHWIHKPVARTALGFPDSSTIASTMILNISGDDFSMFFFSLTKQ